MKQLYIFSFLLLPFILYSGNLSPATAQWTDNPDDNLAIASFSGELIQPKFAPHPDGGAYISWLGNTGSGYDVYLQRIDADGNLLWDESGLIVAQRGVTSTENYGLTADLEGRAALAFRDDRFGSLRITAALIDENGEFLWGEDGVDISGDPGFVASPRITAVSDGGFVAGFTGPGFASIVKLDAAGTISWTHQESGSVNLALSDLAATDAEGETGSSVALFRTLSPTAPGRLSAQKYDADGNRLWDQDRLDVMTDGSLQFGNFPSVASDQNGGMITTWYQSSPSLQVFVQQIGAAGDIRFAEGGLAVSHLSSQLRTNPSAVHHLETDDIYVFWRETDSSQNQIGLYGQRITGEGQLEWGENALPVVPLGSDIGNINTFMMDGDAVVAYISESGSGNDSILASRFSSDGSFVWDDEQVVIASGGSDKFRLEFMNASDTEVFLVWQDYRNNEPDIYAQNLNADGSLGLPDEEPPVPQELVTFSVDMSVQEQAGTFIPESGDRIHVLGEFNEWTATDDSEMLLLETESMIYELALVLEGEAGSSYEYKFFIEAGDDRTLPNGGWEEEVGPGENGNRVVTLTGEDQELEVVYFNNEDEFVSVGDEGEHPVKLRLEQNYPNPFNPVTVIRYSLPQRDHVRIEVFDIQGRQVALLENSERIAGTHQVTFDASGLASGVYISRLQVGNTVLTGKMMLIK